VGNVYIILKQIYSGNGVPNFIGDITKKTLLSLFFLGHSVYYVSEKTWCRTFCDNFINC